MSRPPTSEPVQCAICARSAAEQPLTWTTSLERGRLMLYCQQCSRDNVRAMEGRLDADWFAD